MKKLLLYVICLVLAVGCTFDEDYYVDFSNVGEGFTPISQQFTDLSNGYPEETVLPDGTSVNQAISDELANTTKATSTSASTFLQNLIKWQKKGQVIEISGVYDSVDDNGDPIKLSGKVILPAKEPVKRIILVSHYTIGANSEAPSNTFPLEGQLASLGYAIVVPDYLGYGVSCDRFHPYLIMELTARNVIDMYLAVVPFLEAIGRAPENDDIYLMGYSQGGATTMAVEYVLERDYSTTSSHPIKIKRVFAGGGIYDVKATYESYIETNTASYPCGIPLLIVGQVKGNHLDDELIDELIRPEISKYINEWYLYKNRTTYQMNEIIGTHDTDKILSDVAVDRTSKETSRLYQVMTVNSVLSLAWTPKAPVYMLHSVEDDTVPFENASRAKERWKDGNIQYNFGNYGSHGIACMRFIYTVKTLLDDEED